ncbi:MAG: hypothetical protein L6Q92_16565 [Phycisphaerae bacterium]|nr:hypothetical protein [Phycisphaerae bacterium]
MTRSEHAKLIRANRPAQAGRVLNLCAPVGEWSNVEGGGEGDKPALRRFSMTAYTGGAMALAGWPHPVVIDLAGLQVSARSRPILKDHNRSLIVGHTDSVRIEGSQLLVSGVISGAGPIAREIIDSSRNGFPWQASLGALAERVEFVPKGRKAVANGREFEGPIHVARRATLGEISFVALGADENTSAQVAATAQGDKEVTMDFEKWLEAKGFVAADLTDAQRESLKAMYQAEQKAGSADPGIPPELNNDRFVNNEPENEAIGRIRAEAAVETKRIAEIRRICAGKHADIEAKAIAEGWDVTRTELEVLREERPQVSGVRRGGDQITASAIEAALCLSAGLPEKQVGIWYDERTMNAALSRELRGAGLHVLIYEVIRAAGDYVRPGRVDNETIRAAFAANRRLIEAAAGFSTISLSGILSNVANKAMLAAYEAVESTVGFFCSETDVNDFKEVTRYRMTGNGVFEKVGPDGELKHATLTEESYKNRIETYGRMIALTRQMIINDDLGAFLQIPRIIGRMSALAREQAVFELLLSNPNNFFSVGNKNFLSGVDTSLSIDALTLAEETFANQTDADGKPILVTSAVMLVPTSLKVTAQILMTETRINETTDVGKPKPAANPHTGKWKPVASPYLNAQNLAGGSPKAWYLFANPADVAAIEIAYLRGKRTPTIESGESDFNVLGMQWRGYFDFGVAMQDFRAAVKVKGEA